MSTPLDTAAPWEGYSLAERDRRWDAVRRHAAAAGFNCVLVPLGNGADGQYLTGYRAPAVVLPTDGRPPTVVVAPITERGATNRWVPEPRRVGPEWGRSMAEALLEAGMERARIGVAGLGAGKLSHVRAPDGVVDHSAYADVVARLPSARFEDATDILGLARYVKSDEEIACLRRAAATAEAGIDEMIEVARPGIDAAVLYARVMQQMLALGSEYFPLALYLDPIGTTNPIRYTNPPVGVQLQANALITNEVTAVFGGQVAQEDQPILLGPILEAWRPVIDLQREVFEAGLECMRPGTSFGKLIDLVNGFSARHGMKTRMLLHGCGYGDDGPLLSRRAEGKDVRDLQIMAGNAFVWKPSAMSADERVQFVWGGDVVVTERGGEMLFRRPHGMVSIV